MHWSPNTVRLMLTGCVLSIAPLIAAAQNYAQTNLFSDISQPANADTAPVLPDPNLKNGWGLARGAGSPWWVNNAGTGTSTLYTGTGVNAGLVVTVPNAKGKTTPSAPTGIVFNGTTDFVITAASAVPPATTPASAPAVFIFATKNGTISGWNPVVTPISAGATGVVSTAINVVDESKQGAAFTGLTWVEIEGNHFLLAANFSARRIEAFDAKFARVRVPEPAFFDPAIPYDFAPYNVQAVGADVVVTYAKQNPSKTSADDSCEEVCGFVDVFSASGKFLRRLQDGPWLRAPWGAALAPQDFGFFSHDLLIGNRFGGTIAAFNIVSGRFLGNLLDANSSPIAIDGLWGLEFDNRGSNEAAGPLSSTTGARAASAGPALFFAAGINDYADGLFGFLTPLSAQLTAEDHE